MTKLLVLTCVIAIAGLVASSSALAGPCKADAQRFCAGMKGERVSRCLDEHQAHLSPTCVAHRGKKAGKAKGATATKAAVASVGKACKADIAKLCDEVKPGEGRVTACLRSHAKKLSADCHAALEHGQARKASFGKACQHDLAKYCKNARADRTHGLACLRQFQHDLTPACKAETGL